MTITTIDRPTTRILSEEAEQALKAVADKFGLKLVRGNGRYSPTSLTVKFDFQVIGSNGVSKKAAQGAGLLGLPTDIVGRQFKSGRGGLYTVTDINLRRPKYPVSATGPKGGRYKFSVSQVQAGLVGGNGAGSAS